MVKKDRHKKETGTQRRQDEKEILQAKKSLVVESSALVCDWSRLASSSQAPGLGFDFCGEL